MLHNILEVVFSALSGLAENIDVNEYANQALSLVVEKSTNPKVEVVIDPEAISNATLNMLDIHCKAFVVGFISTCFTLLPFLVSYASRQGIKLDTSKTVIGLAKVGGIGGVVFTITNWGNPLVREEYSKVSEFIHPYIPMLTGAMGRGNYDPVFQEMMSVSGVSGHSSTYLNPISGRPNPSNPASYSGSSSSWLSSGPTYEKKVPVVQSGNNHTWGQTVVTEKKPDKVFEMEPEIQIKEPDIGSTVILDFYTVKSDTEYSHVYIEDLEEVYSAPGSKGIDDQEDFEFDRDALYEFDTP